MDIMTQAAFARLHDVSRKTVTDWKKRGYLRLSGDLVDVAASNAALAGVGRSRLPGVTRTAASLRTDAQGNTSKVRAPPQVTLLSAELTEQARSMPLVLTLSVMTGSSVAIDLAKALLDHLPAETVRPLVQKVMANIRADAVVLVEDDLEPPAGLTTWAYHPWFTDSLLGEADWMEVQAEYQRAKQP